jgi:hypothetical protein
MNLLLPSIAAVAFLLLAVWKRTNARRQKRVLGLLRYRDSLQTARLLAKFSGRVATLEGVASISVVVGLVLLAYQSARGSTVLFGILGVVLVVTGLGQWVRGGVPPSMLVLGSSGEDQIALQVSLRNAIFPFRPVSLLQTGRMSLDTRIPGDCYRIDREVDWRDAVAALCRTVGVIVLDARTLTEFVEEEVRHLADAGHEYKSLFIGPAQAAPTAAAFPGPESAAAFLRHLFLEAETLPTREVPISAIALRWPGGPHEPVQQ